MWVPAFYVPPCKPFTRGDSYSGVKKPVWGTFKVSSMDHRANGILSLTGEHSRIGGDIYRPCVPRQLAANFDVTIRYGLYKENNRHVCAYTCLEVHVSLHTSDYLVTSNKYMYISCIIL